MVDIEEIEREIERQVREIEEDIKRFEAELEGEAGGGGEPDLGGSQFRIDLPKSEEDIDYCLECIEKHLQTAKVLMREAIQRAAAGEPTEKVVEKIRGVVEELAGAEDDSDTTTDMDVRRLNSKIRALRKEIWRRGLSVRGGTLEELNEIKRKIDALVDEAYRVAELKRAQVSECPWCNDVILATCRKVPVDKRAECFKAFKDIMSDRKEDVMRGAEKLKELGVFEDAYNFIVSLHKELFGGGGGEVHE